MNISDGDLLGAQEGEFEGMDITNLMSDSPIVEHKEPAPEGRM